MSQFQEQFFQKILSMEGGYQANASDVGNYACDKLCGTKFGIAASSYQTYTKRCPTPEIMKGLTEEFAMGFYQWYGEFWRLDEIEDQEVYELVFNNFMGMPVAAARTVQKALNHFGYGLDEDGKMGSKTLAALNDAVRQNKPAVYNRILEEWGAYLNTTQEVFRQGLLNRISQHFPPLSDAHDMAVVEVGGATYILERMLRILRGASRGNWQDLLVLMAVMIAIGLIFFSGVQLFLTK